MKLLCNRGALLEALSIVNEVVPGRSSKPELQCVKLKATDHKMILCAADKENYLHFVISQVQIEEPGECLLPAEILLDIARRSFDDTMSIQQIADIAEIRDQDARYKIFTQTHEDFPPILGFEADEDLAGFTIAGGVLKRLISQSAFALREGEGRYSMNGILCEAKGRKITFVATDGIRLAIAKGDLLSDKFGKDGAKAIIPAKALALIDKLVDDPEEPVEFQIRENQVVFHTSHATLTSNLVERKFPPYEDLVPKDTDKKMTASTADFLGAIHKAELLTTIENKAIRFRFSKSGAVLSVGHFEIGEVSVNFPCRYDGADFEIGFHPPYLIEALKVIDADEFTLGMTAMNRAGVLTAGRDFKYVVMPVNLD